MNVEFTEIKEGYAAAQEISEFIDRSGAEALNFKANLSDSLHVESRRIRWSRLIPISGRSAFRTGQ